LRRGPATDGLLRGDFTLPPGLPVAEIGADQVPGIARDAMGLELVRRHGVIGP